MLLVTAALFMSRMPAGRLTGNFVTRTKTDVAPGNNKGSEAVTIPLEPTSGLTTAQPESAENDTKVAPDGMTSANDTPDIAEVPTLATWIK